MTELEATDDRPRILIVDDDVSVARALIRCLSLRCDVHCVATHDGLSAFRLLGVQTYAVIVADMAMVGMSGIELLRLAKERWPEMRRILFSGYSDSALVLADKDNADAVLEKGSDIQLLCATICDLAATPRAGPVRSA